MLEFVCLPWSEVCSARVTSLLLLLLLLLLSVVASLSANLATQMFLLLLYAQSVAHVTHNTHTYGGAALLEVDYLMVSVSWPSLRSEMQPWNYIPLTVWKCCGVWRL